MAEKLPDDRESQRRPGAHRGEAVAQIMEADSIKACHLAYCVPRPLKVRARLSYFFAGNDVGIAVNPGQGGQDRCSRSRKVDRLSPGLRVGKEDHAALKINMLPFGVEDFAES